MKGSSNAPKIVHSNKNLLDNWDFTNPINQRGQSSYSSYPNTTNDNIFSLDRWHLLTGYLGVDNDYCSFGRISSTNGAILYQELSQDTIKSIIGKTITASIKFSDGSYRSFTHLIPTTLPFNIDTVLGSFTWTVNSRNYHIDLWSWKDDSSLNHIQFRVWEDERGTYSSSNRLKISAVKLELGEVSTLKNDLLGVSYAEELIKCKRYLYRISTAVNVHTRLFGACAGHNDTLLTTSILMPDNFRETNASPVLEISDISQFSVIKGDTEKAVTGIAVSGASDQSVPLDIHVESGGIDEGAAYLFLMKANSWIQFSKEL